MYYLGGFLILLGLGVDVYLVWAIGEKDEQIASLVGDVVSLKWEVAEQRNDPDFDCGFHFNWHHGQHIEIRCDGDGKKRAFKCPLHVQENGALEIATDGKALIVLYKIDLAKIKQE